MYDFHTKFDWRQSLSALRTGNYKITMKSAEKIRTKQFYQNLLFGNLEKLAKNRQVCPICHINVNRNQETGNRQTDKVL